MFDGVTGLLMVVHDNRDKLLLRQKGASVHVTAVPARHRRLHPPRRPVRKAGYWRSHSCCSVCCCQRFASAISPTPLPHDLNLPVSASAAGEVQGCSSYSVICYSTIDSQKGPPLQHDDLRAQLLRHLDRNRGRRRPPRSLGLALLRGLLLVYG